MDLSQNQYIPQNNYLCLWIHPIVQISASMQNQTHQNQDDILNQLKS